MTFLNILKKKEYNLVFMKLLELSEEYKLKMNATETQISCI